MDDAAQIDLALNSDFDPSLFDCWDDNAGKQDYNQCNKDNDNDIDKNNNFINEMKHQNEHESSRSSVPGTLHNSSSFQDNSNSTLLTKNEGVTMDFIQEQQTGVSQQQLHPLGITSSANCPPHLQIQQQHNSNQQQNNNFLQQQQQQVQSNQIQYQQQNQSNEQQSIGNGYCQHPGGHVTTGNDTTCFQQQQQQIVDPSLIPLAFNAALAAGNNNNNNNFQNPLSYFLVPQQQQTQSGNSSQSQESHKSITQQSQQQQHQRPQNNNGTQQTYINESVFVPFPQTQSSSTSQSIQQQPTTNPTPQQQSSQPQQRKSKSHTSRNSTDLPPFLLFDAPIELRANFMASQRQHGLPTMQDNNSVHYGMVVNGFHPQQGQTSTTASQQQQQQTTSIDISGVLSGGNVSSSNSSAQVRLIDGRHGNVGNKRVKNAREQKRTQKITDLIDELRIKMERGGWKVGLKSKFHTLSSCAEYVKHLVQVNVEKEEALKKACSDLEAKKRKIEDEDKAQQDPSDPESTTSSLTISSSSTRHRPDNNNNVKSNSGDAGNTTTNNISNKKKEKEKVAHDLKNDNGATSSTGSNTDDKEKCQTETSNSTNHKKARLSSHVSSLSSSGSSGDNGCGSGKQDQARGVMLSSVSDITDSNKGGSSSEGNRSGSSQRSTSVECQHGDTDSGEYESAGGGTGTVSSDAAVARGQDNHGHETCHADVVITKNRKRKTNIINDDSEFIDVSTQKKEEASSLETSFQLDYEEVFLRSNVPQILATTSGRIVAWNDFFLKITGLKSEEVERLTFFSLVQPNRLSSLFEIVAAALRSGTAQDPNALNEGTSNGVSEISTTSEIDETVRVANTDTSNDMNAGNDMNADNDQEKQNKSVSKRNWNYSAITLPCISFQPSDQTQPKIVNIKINETAMEGSKEVNDKQDDLLQKSDEPNPLYITVTLMTDDDPRKRCFHCVFTDCSGTNGSLGSITPDLLSMLFTKQHLSKMSKDN